ATGRRATAGQNRPASRRPIVLLAIMALSLERTPTSIAKVRLFETAVLRTASPLRVHHLEYGEPLVSIITLYNTIFGGDNVGARGRDRASADACECVAGLVAVDLPARGYVLYRGGAGD